MYDMIIIGGGPAGISAALTAANRHRSVLLLTNDYHANPLAKAHLVTNYPGLPDVTGAELMETMDNHVRKAEVTVETKKVVQVMDMGDRFSCATSSEFYEGRSLILAMGQAPAAALPGEKEYLGRGISYCATCDGMLYRKKRIAVLGTGPDAPEETNFLASIGCEVTYFGRGARPAELRDEIPFHKAQRCAVKGDGTRITAFEADGTEYPADGVFLLRAGVAADSLVPGLITNDGHISVDEAMRTSVPGVFAAGDCTGKPYQIAKAAGQGNIAALEADRWLESKTERKES